MDAAGFKVRIVLFDYSLVMLFAEWLLIAQSERTGLAREIRDCLKRSQDVEPGKFSYTHMDKQAWSLLLT